MGWFTRFVAVITCRGSTTSDEKALEERNKLRKKLGKNKIVPKAQTDLDIKAERIQTSRKESPTSWDIFTVEKNKDEIVVGDKKHTAAGIKDEQVAEGDVNTGGVEKAGGDAAMYEFALHYVKTFVIPGAVERYAVEQDREKHNVSVASTGGSSDISMAVSDIVRTSLTNAQDLLKQEQMRYNSKEHLKEPITYDKSGTSKISGDIGEN